MARNVVITGGSSGLGLALGAPLARRGDAVTLVARSTEKLRDGAAAITAAVGGGSVRTLAVDVRNPEALAHGFSALASETGGIDVLINSAGILREGYFETLSIETHREVMETNYFGTLNAIHAALPHIERSSRGRIVNVSSVAGLTGVFGYSAYCASKYALVGLSETLRYELAPRGITVQLVCPGEFDSPMVDELERSRTPENREHTLTIPKVGVDVVVRAIVDGMDSERFLIVPGAMARLSVAGLRLFPGISRKVGDARIRKARAAARLGTR